jgi:hypothetical protein
MARAPRPPNPRLEAAKLARRYRALLAVWSHRVEDMLRARLDGHRSDADDLEDAYASLFEAAGLVPELDRTARAVAKKSRTYTAKQTDRAVGWTHAEQEAVERFRNENLRLIKDLGQDSFVKLAREFRPAQAAGMRYETIAPRVQEILGVTERHAKLIARDQTAKLNSQIAQAHQEAAGVSEYIWRTVGDGAVRGNPGGLYPPGKGKGDHYHLNGTRQRWALAPVTNPSTGERNHPGRDIQCRCFAEPVIDGRAPSEVKPEKPGRVALQETRKKRAPQRRR